MKKLVAMGVLMSLLGGLSPVCAQDVPKKEVRATKKNPKIELIKKAKSEYAAVLKAANDAFLESSQEAANTLKTAQESAKKNKSKQESKAAREAFKEAMKIARATRKETIISAKALFEATKKGEQPPLPVVATTTPESVSSTPAVSQSTPSSTVPVQ